MLLVMVCSWSPLGSMHAGRSLTHTVLLLPWPPPASSALALYLFSLSLLAQLCSLSGKTTQHSLQSPVLLWLPIWRRDEELVSRGHWTKSPSLLPYWPSTCCASGKADPGALSEGCWEHSQTRRSAKPTGSRMWALVGQPDQQGEEKAIAWSFRALCFLKMAPRILCVVELDRRGYVPSSNHLPTPMLVLYMLLSIDSCHIYVDAGATQLVHAFAL